MASTQTSAPDSGKFTFRITRILRQTLPVLRFFRATENFQKEISKINWAKHLEIPSQFRRLVHRAWERVKVAPSPATRRTTAVMKRVPFPTRQTEKEVKLLPREIEDTLEEQGRSKRRMTNNDHCALRWTMEEDGSVGVTSVPVEEAPEIARGHAAEMEWIRVLKEAKVAYANHVASFIQYRTNVPYEDYRRIRNKTFSQLVPSKRPFNSASLSPREIRIFNDHGKDTTIRQAVSILLEAMEKRIIKTDLTFTSLSNAQLRFWELCRSEVQQIQPILSTDVEDTISAKTIAETLDEVDRAVYVARHNHNLTTITEESFSVCSTPRQPSAQAKEPQLPPLAHSEDQSMEEHGDDDQGTNPEDVTAVPHTPKVFRVPSESGVYTEDETTSYAEKNKTPTAAAAPPTPIPSAQAAAVAVPSLEQPSPSTHTATVPSSPPQSSGLTAFESQPGGPIPELLTTPIRVHLLQHEQTTPNDFSRFSSPVIPRSAFAKRQSLEFGTTSDSFGAGSPSWTRHPDSPGGGRITKAFNRSRRRQSMPLRSVLRATAPRMSVSPSKSVTFEDDEATVGLTQRLRFDQSIVEHVTPDPTVVSPGLGNAGQAAAEGRSSPSLPPMKSRSAVVAQNSPTPEPITPAPAQRSKVNRGPPAPTPRELRVVDIDARQQPFLFGTPIKSTKTPKPIEKLAQVVEELQDHATVGVKRESERLIVRFKISVEHAHLFPPSQGDDESNFSASQLTTGSAPNWRPSHSAEAGLEDESPALAINSGLLATTETPSRFDDSFNNPNVTMRDTTRSRHQKQRASKGSENAYVSSDVPQSDNSLPSFREFSYDPATPTHLQGIKGFESPYPNYSAAESAASPAFPSTVNVETGSSQKLGTSRHQLLPPPSSVRTPRFRTSLAPPPSSPACPYTDGPTLIVPDFAQSPSGMNTESFSDSPGAQIANEIEYYSPKKPSALRKSTGLPELPAVISTPSHLTEDQAEKSSSLYTTANEELSKISLGQLSPGQFPSTKLPITFSPSVSPSMSHEAASSIETAKNVVTEADAPTTPQVSKTENTLTQEEEVATTPITFTPVNKTATPIRSEPEQARTNVYQMTQEEIEQRDYMSDFLSRHRENSRNKRSNTTETGSPVAATKRQPLGAKSPNTPSPARVKRKADELESDDGSPKKNKDPQSPKKVQSPKKNRRTAKAKPKANKAQAEEIVARGPPLSATNEGDADTDADELADDADASSRRSKRLKTSAPKSSIPTAIKVGRVGSVLKGSKTGDNDSAYQTRANTKKNKGSSEYPTEVLARMSSQEKSDEEVNQDEAKTVVKKGAKSVMWKTPLESHQEHIEPQEEVQAEQKPKKAGKPELGMAKKGQKTQRQPKEETPAEAPAEAPAEEPTTNTKADKEVKPKPKGKVTLGTSRIAKPSASKLPAKKTVSNAAQALGMVANGTPAKPQRMTRSRTKAKAKANQK